MERNISEEEKEAIINFGAFGYDASKMASILGWEEKEVQEAMQAEEFTTLLQKGKDMGEYAIDKKLWEMALSGDMKAMERFEARKKVRSLLKKKND